MYWFKCNEKAIANSPSGMLILLTTPFYLCISGTFFKVCVTWDDHIRQIIVSTYHLDWFSEFITKRNVLKFTLGVIEVMPNAILAEKLLQLKANLNLIGVFFQTKNAFDPIQVCICNNKSHGCFHKEKFGWDFALGAWKCA